MTGPTGIRPSTQPAFTAANPTLQPFPGFTVPAGYMPGPSLMDVMTGVGVMMRGQASPDIKQLQAALNAAGANPPLAQDGLFGPKTEAAMNRFLGQTGQTQDGKFGRDALLAFQRHPAFDPNGSWDPGRLNQVGVNGPVNRAPRDGEPAPNGTTSAHDFQQADNLRRANADRVANNRGNQVQLDVPWFSQFDRANVEGAGDSACYRATRAMARAAGVNIPPGTGNRIQVATGEDSLGRVQTNRQRTDAARGYIDSQLDAGRPVSVGVSHKNANYNQDGITDHFVLVTGRGVDNQGRQYYTYNDPATTNRQTGTSNRFYVDPNSGNLVHQGNLASGYVVDRHTEMSMVVRNQ